MELTLHFDMFYKSLGRWFFVPSGCIYGVLVYGESTCLCYE